MGVLPKKGGSAKQTEKLNKKIELIREKIEADLSDIRNALGKLQS